MTGIQIYRTDLTKPGKPEMVAGYGEISLWLALQFMERFATKEAESRGDVDHVSRVSDKRDERVITRFTLVGNAPNRPSLAEYTYRITDQ